MGLKIEAPNIEARLMLEARNRGVSAAEYAVSILEASLPPDTATNESEASIEGWIAKFHEWVHGHPAVESPLPVSATTRAQFYDEDGR